MYQKRNLGHLGDILCFRDIESPRASDDWILVKEIILELTVSSSQCALPGLLPWWSHQNPPGGMRGFRLPSTDSILSSSSKSKQKTGCSSLKLIKTLNPGVFLQRELLSSGHKVTSSRSEQWALSRVWSASLGGWGLIAVASSLLVLWHQLR